MGSDIAPPPLVVRPAEISAAIHDQYRNVSIAKVNDHEVRLSVMTGGFDWHSHPDSDETFLVLEGELLIQFEESEVRLSPGELLTVPKGVIHRTEAIGERSVNLTFERTDADSVSRTPINSTGTNTIATADDEVTG